MTFTDHLLIVHFNAFFCSFVILNKKNIFIDLYLLTLVKVSRFKVYDNTNRKGCIIFAKKHVFIADRYFLYLDSNNKIQLRFYTVLIAK